MIKPEDIAAPALAKTKEDVYKNLERWIDNRLSKGIFQIHITPLGIQYSDKDVIDKIIQDYGASGWEVISSGIFSFCWQTTLTFMAKK